MQLLKGEMSSSKQISYHMTALPWVNLRSSCIREQFPEGKKTGRKEKKKNQTARCSLFSKQTASASAPKEAVLFQEEHPSFGRPGNVFSHSFSLVRLVRRNEFVDSFTGPLGKYLWVKSHNRLELNTLENAAGLAEYKSPAFRRDT